MKHRLGVSLYGRARPVSTKSRGLLHARDGDFGQAAQVLEVAVEGDPDFLDARQKLAVSYLKLGRIEESKRELNTLKERQEAAGDHAQHDH